MMVNDGIAAALVAVLDDHGGAWQGTAGDLLALLPDMAADATRLSRLLGEAVADLTVAGVTVERHREAGTGRRVLRLGTASRDAGDDLRRTAKLPGGSLRTAGISEPESHETGMGDAVTLPVVAADDPIALIFGPWVAAALRGG